MKLAGGAPKFPAVRCDQIDFQAHQASPVGVPDRGPRDRNGLASLFMSCDTGGSGVPPFVGPVTRTTESAEAGTEPVTDTDVDQSRTVAGPQSIDARGPRDRATRRNASSSCFQEVHSRPRQRGSCGFSRE